MLYVANDLKTGLNQVVHKMLAVPGKFFFDPVGNDCAQGKTLVT